MNELVNRRFKAHRAKAEMDLQAILHALRNAYIFETRAVDGKRLVEVFCSTEIQIQCDFVIPAGLPDNEFRVPQLQRGLNKLRPASWS